MKHFFILRALIVLVALSFQAALADASGFFPDVQSAGSVSFKVYPIKAAPVGQPVRVSFGVPLPRGYLSDLALLRVLNESGAEIPIGAKVLLPWRDLGTEQTLASFRSVLIQADLVFQQGVDGAPAPIALSLEWGAARTMPPVTLSPVKDDWVLVDDANFPAEHQVYEPLAYAVFSPEWYGNNVIKTRTLPFNSHPDMSAYDHAFQLFGDTAINRVDPRVTDSNLQPYLTQYAGWLFDRTMTLYQLAFRSGEFRYFRAAHRAAQFYASHINAAGYFDLKSSNDMKYSYGEGLLTNFMLQGDPEIPDRISSMLPAWDSFASRYTETTNFWTERHAAFKLLGYVTAYELTGDAAIAQKAKATFGDLVEMQNQPIPGMPVTGGLMHTSGDHSEGGNEIMASPWMSTLLVDAVERFYLHSADTRVPEFIRKMADFFKREDGVSLCEWSGYSGKDYYFLPYYFAGESFSDGWRDPCGFSYQEHAIDVTKILALAYYFSRQSGQPDISYLTPLSKLYHTQADKTFLHWIRPTAPASLLAAYRLSPPRKFSWWFRTTSNLDFLVGTDTSLNHFDGQTVPRLSLVQNMLGNEFYKPGDEFTFEVVLENVGSIAAENVVVHIETMSRSGNALEVVSFSDGGVNRTSSVAWKIPTLAPDAPAQTFSLTVRAKDFEVIPQPERPVISLISLARVDYCAPGQVEPDCVLPTSNWDVGQQPYHYSSNWDVIAPLPPLSPPQLSITSHPSQALVEGEQRFVVDAADEHGVAHVEFILDGQWVATVAAAPYEWLFDTNSLAEGFHELLVRAYDRVGSVQEQRITITPQNPDRTPPSVDILSPESTSYGCNDALQLDYSATDLFSVTRCELVMNQYPVELPGCHPYQLPDMPVKLASRIGLLFDGSGDAITDSSPLASHGQRLGATRTSRDDKGGAMHFDGIDDYLSFEEPQLAIEDAVTVAFWMKPDADEGVIMSQNWWYIGSEFGWVVHLGPTNHNNNNARSISWASSNNSGNFNENIVVQTPENVIELGVWQHVAITKSAAEVVIYINGEEQARGTLATPEINWPVGASQAFWIGRKMNHTENYQNHYAGSLDDIYIWNQRLLPQQIQELYQDTPLSGEINLTLSAFDPAGNIGQASLTYTRNSCLATPEHPSIWWRHQATGQNWMYQMDGSAIVESKALNQVPLIWEGHRADIDGDGEQDIIWRNSETGANYGFILDGFSLVEGRPLPSVDLDWQIAAIADFSGDAKDDILWQQASTGKLWLYVMNGLRVEASHYIATVSDPQWHVVAAGDINGDSMADILWQHEQGSIWVYQMNAHHIANSYPLTTVPDGWALVAAADFSGDGTADLLWRNRQTGVNWLYEMSQGQIARSRYINTVADQAWQPRQWTDLNLDGQADLLWRHAGSGATAIYFMQAERIERIHSFGLIPTDWRIVQ